MENYNCNGSIDSSYGASTYGHCTTSSIGAPITGFEQLTTTGSLSILLPLAALIFLTIIAILVVRRKKSHSKG